MKPSNPATYFIDGGAKHKSFTFDPGKTLYYVTIRSDGYIPVSILLFANDKKHVEIIMLHWIDFQRDCAKQYEKKENRLPFSYQPEQLRSYEKAIKGEPGDYYFTVIEANTDQFYKVGWAFNDTI